MEKTHLIILFSLVVVAHSRTRGMLTIGLPKPRSEFLYARCGGADVPRVERSEHRKKRNDAKS